MAVWLQIFSSATQRYVLSEYQPILLSENRGPTKNFLQLKHRIFVSVSAGGSRFFGQNLVIFKTSKHPNLNLDGYSYIEKTVVVI